MSGALGSLTVELALEDGQFTTRVSTAGQTLTTFNQTVNNTISHVNQADRAFSGAAGTIALWTQALGQARAALDNVTSAFGGWIERLVETNAQIERTTALMRGLSTAVTDAGRSADAAKSMQGLLDFATKTPYSLNTLTDTMVKLKTAGIDPMNGSMKALTDAIAAFGGNDQRLQRAGYAIQEMAGRGVISLQNLRRQLGQDIPGAVELMARSMNLTVEQLDEAVRKGTLNSANALARMLEEFNRTYGGASQALMSTFTGRVSQLNTAMTRLALVAGGQAKPAIEGLSKAAPQGFYEQLTADMGKLVQVMSSPQMTKAAVDINQALTSLLHVGESVGRMILDWQSRSRWRSRAS